MGNLKIWSWDSPPAFFLNFYIDFDTLGGQIKRSGWHEVCLFDAAAKDETRSQMEAMPYKPSFSPSDIVLLAELSFFDRAMRTRSSFA